MTNIPKIIHQTWKTNEIPMVMKNYVKSWRTLHPDYEYKLWTDADIRNFIETEYPWFLHLYDSYPHHIMRVDAFRFFVLYHYGGVYVDLDLEAFKPIDSLLQPNNVILFKEHPDSISNAIMAAPPRHPFIEYCIKQLMITHRKVGVNTDAWAMTGPKFLTDTLNNNDPSTHSDIKIYPPEYYFPIPWHKPRNDQSGSAAEYPLAFGAHHWQGTWWQPQDYGWQWHTLILLVLFIGITITGIIILILN